MKHIFSLVREIILPAGCGACGSMLCSVQEAWQGLCRACQKHFEIDRADRCSICGRPLISEKNTCMQCRKSAPHHFDRVTALYPYAGAYRNMLRSFKFEQKVNIGNFLAKKLVQALDLFHDKSLSNGVFVPVPPRHGKIKETNFDQIECLATKLGKYKGIRINRCLKRLPSKSQKELGVKERLVNLQNKILCVKPPPKIALLFDDVITSGATMDACASALKAAGCEKVFGICLFYD